MLSIEVLQQIVDEISDGVYVVDRTRRIIFWNRGAERITGYSAAEMVGQHCWNNLLQHVDATGCQLCFRGCPLVATITDSHPRESRVSLRHHEGHRVPVHARTRPLINADGEIWGAVETFSDMSAEQAVQYELEQLRQQAMLDPLTRLGNRRYLEAQLDGALQALQSYGWSFGVLLLDIDHFKRVNDTYGHPIGDAVLRMVSETLARHIRRSDTIGRWGGEEFMLIARQIDNANLHRLGEQLRTLVVRSTLPYGDTAISVTVSIGATTALVDDTLSAIFTRVDRLLYVSKANGRNRVTGDLADLQVGSHVGMGEIPFRQRS